jgi:hypothetical protein
MSRLATPDRKATESFSREPLSRSSLRVVLFGHIVDFARHLTQIETKNQ